MFRGTRLDATIDQIRYLRPDVAIVDDVTFTLCSADGQPFAMFAAGRSSAGFVATMIPFARPVAGPLERLLAISRE